MKTRIVWVECDCVPDSGDTYIRMAGKNGKRGIATYMNNL